MLLGLFLSLFVVRAGLLLGSSSRGLVLSLVAVLLVTMIDLMVTSVDVVLVRHVHVALFMVVWLGVEVGLLPWVLLVSLLLSMDGCVVEVVVLNSVACGVLQVMEQLVELVLDCAHHARSFMLLHIMVVAVALVNVVGLVVPSVDEILAAEVMIGDVLKLEVTLVGVLRAVDVLIMVPVVSLRVVSPVIWLVFDTVAVVVLVDMLWVVLTIITV